MDTEKFAPSILLDLVQGTGSTGLHVSSWVGICLEHLHEKIQSYWRYKNDHEIVIYKSNLQESM